MAMADYILEAAQELQAPAELGFWRNFFVFETASQEWCFRGLGSQGFETLPDARQWVERICGWLQYKYPEGPRGELEEI
jgi:hypothetical protein